MSTLHALALGCHWWHAAQVIPYLVAHASADTELRNQRRETPLHIALDKPCVFQKQAVQTLIHLGADVNAIDGQGRSCLALAGKDADLLRLLLARGAKLTTSALFGAIDGHNIESLEALLLAGIDPNMWSDTADEKVLQERRNGPMVFSPANSTWTSVSGMRCITLRRRVRRHGCPLPVRVQIGTSRPGRWQRCWPIGQICTQYSPSRLDLGGRKMLPILCYWRR